MNANPPRSETSTGVMVQDSDSVHSVLVEDLNKVLTEIKDVLEVWKNTEMSALPDKTAHVKHILETSEITKSYRTQLSSLLITLEQIQDKLAPITTEELTSLYEKAIALRVRLESFDPNNLPSTSLSLWLSVLNPIKKSLEALRINELASLLSLVDQIKEKGARKFDLSSMAERFVNIDESLGFVDKLELFSLPKRFNTIMTEVEMLAKKPGRFRLPKITEINPLVLAGLITAVFGLCGTVSTAIINSRGKQAEVLLPIQYTQTAAQQTLQAAAISISETPVLGTISPSATNVTVSFSNPSNHAIVHVTLIKDGVVHDKFDMGPGSVESRILPQGSYQIEAHAAYPKMTPSSPNCYIQWQESTSYTGNLIINVNTTIVQVKQFYLEPQDVCFTQTPVR